MKKKYPPVEREKAIPLFVKNLVKEEKETGELPASLSKKGFKEKTLEFKGKNMDILFSSKGFGIKQIKLKGYSNRDKKPVIFNSPEKPLFSSWFFRSSKNFIPFQIEKQGGGFVGLYSSPQGRIKKTIELNEKKFLLLVQTEIQPEKERGFKGLSLTFSHVLPPDLKGGFLKMFFVYGQDLLKTFVSYEGDQIGRPSAEEIKEPQVYLNANSVALGGKYFGKAFMNNSPFFPSALVEREAHRASARIDYEFLHSKDQILEYKAFLGPKSLKNLQTQSGNLKQWLDFGFFSWMARPLLLFLNGLYKYCQNWGLAIILLTFFIRLALLPINLKSYKSMKIMQKLQPQMKELREIHKSDPKKANLEIMALMKKHKANPLGGCLPLFLQLPVFFALYRALGEGIELYQSPFIFWIKDLSLKDPYYVLPVLTGLVFFIQQSITPMNIPKAQARLLKAAPLLFSVFMLALPSCLTLYLFVSGLFGLVQQFFFVKLGLSYFKGGENDKIV